MRRGSPRRRGRPLSDVCFQSIRRSKPRYRLVLAVLGMLWDATYMSALLDGPEMVIPHRPLPLLRTRGRTRGRRIARVIGQLLVAGRTNDDALLLLIPLPLLPLGGLRASLPREPRSGRRYGRHLAPRTGRSLEPMRRERVHGETAVVSGVGVSVMPRLISTTTTRSRILWAARKDARA